MGAYIIRRILYAFPVLFGINLITFSLFFMLNSPDDMARLHLGGKYVTEDAILHWKKNHGYDKPLFYAPDEKGLSHWTHTLFFTQSLSLFVFDFGVSDSGRDISQDIHERMWPSLAIAAPVLLLGLTLNIVFALTMVFFRNTYLDLVGIIACIILMSVSGLFYIIGGQYLIGTLLKWVPISGYAEGPDALRFVALPVVIGIISGLGMGSRWYRTLFLEELGKDYVRTARAKGLPERWVLYRHVLGNAMIPILTGIVVIIPSLFMGSLILESFFGIPGLGSYTIDAIARQDFAAVRAMVFLGSVLYLVGLILTDLTYAWVDPRVRFS